MIESPQTLIILAAACYLCYGAALIIKDKNDRRANQSIFCPKYPHENLINLKPIKVSFACRSS